jgi:hypothetical protein
MAREHSHGTIYGRLVWRGKAKDRDTKITSTLKKGWRIVEFPNYESFAGKLEQIESIIPNGGRSC